MRTVLKLTAGLTSWTSLILGMVAYVVAVVIALSAHA
jgi:hypothetical protein